MLKKLWLFLLSMAPGLFLLGYNIGTGSVTSMASAGADYGMGLFWTLIVSALFTYVMIVAVTRLTIASGDTLLTGMRKIWGQPIALAACIMLVGSDIFGMMGVMGIIGDVLQEWTKQWLPGGVGIAPIVSIPILMVALGMLFWVGKHSFFEKILVVMVVSMAAGFLISLIFTVPSPGEVVKGLVPMIPEGAGGKMLIGGMVGTTLCAAVIAVRPILVSEAGWKPSQMKEAGKDTLFSVVMMVVLSGAVMACAAGTLHARGLHITKAIDMVATLEPLGKMATSVFVFGILGAGLSSVFPLMLLAPWMICDYKGIPRNPKATWFRVVALLALAQAPIGTLLGMKPVSLMIATQALSSIAMPFLSIYILIAINNSEIMKEHKAGWLLNAGCFATLIFSTFMAYFSLRGLVGNFTDLFF